MDKIEKIYRTMGIVDQMSSDDVENRHVSGYAIVFDTPSEDMGFIETISRNAITQEFVDKCDVLAFFNHDQSKVFARSNKGRGSLKLTVDERGLKYEFDAPKTDLGDELLEYIRRGDVSQSSFGCFIDRKDHDAVTTERRNGKLFKTINKIAYLFDVSPVFQPAYDATSVVNRSKEEAKKEYDEIVEREKNYDEMLNDLEQYKI